MSSMNSRFRKLRRCSAGVFALAIVSTCLAGGKSKGARELLDEKSGVTVLTANDPMVFARTESQYSRSERDYLYLGPVETNRRGTRDYYLWVGLGTTIDRGYFAPLGHAPTTLYLQVQGAPMELKLEAWLEREPALGRLRLYRTPVKLRAELAARVTLDQLKLIAGESPKSVRVVTGDADGKLYFLWKNVAAWPEFLATASTP
jgi:hypothetical protein